MRSGIAKALLIGENPHGCWYLANRLHGHGCECSFAISYQEARSSLQAHDFELVLSPTKLWDITALPLIDLLEGSMVTLFYSHAVEQGCWWLPALRHGEKCFGSPALRPSEFVSVLDEVIAEIRTHWRVTEDLRKPAKQSTLSVLVAHPSRRESTPPVPVSVRHPALKKLAR